MRKWDINEINEAIDFNKNGYSYKDIAFQLNRTTKSVKIKLNKLGYFNNDRTYFETVSCLNCQQDFKSRKIEKRIFCSHTCSAVYNNKKRTRVVKNDELNKRKRERYHNTKNNECLFCGEKVYDKFCNAICQKSYNQKLIFDKIENDTPIEIGTDSTNHRWYKKYLISIHGEKCMECGWDKKNPVSNKIPIELEHIDGVSKNNKLENLKLLCPNCHSLTPTYKSLNKGNGRYNRMERYREGKSF